MAAENEGENEGEEIPGFSDAEIDEEMKPWLEEVDRDYAAALEPLVKVFEAKGPPPPDENTTH